LISGKNLVYIPSVAVLRRIFRGGQMHRFLKVFVAGCALAQASVASAEWNEAVSKHFHVYADEPADELRAFATKLERFDAAVREARGVPDVEPGASTQVTLYVLRDIKEVQKVFGGSGVGGFYLPKASGSVAFVPRKGEPGTKYRLTGENVFFHEYTHHLMLQDADRPLPTWLTEGFAEFFASPIFNEDGSVTIGAPPTYRAEALYTIWGLPLEKWISGDYTYVTAAEYESIYGRGWLLTHLLSFDLKRRGQLTRYLNEIQAGVPAEKAATDSFGDLKQLDRELEAYFRADKFTVATIPASRLHLPPIQVRALSPAMAAMMDINIKYARGGKPFRAAAAADEGRGILARYPADARATTLQAEVEVAAEQYSEALKHADLALRLDPKSDKAMLAKGEALMQLAKANPKSADWAGIRSYFLQANKIDPENAQPLILFYRSFVSEGVPPTKNAVDGLTYALTLVPQDAKLRLELIGQLLNDKRWDDARKALVPLAYSPHAGKWHDTVVKVLQAVEKKDNSQATTAWQAAQRMINDD
jgi:tetratricopeptide (TPR) repeat protein